MPGTTVLEGDRLSDCVQLTGLLRSVDPRD